MKDVMKRLSSTVVHVIVLAICMTLLGCGGESKEVASVDLSGRWRTTYSMGYGGTMTLLQSNGILTGSYIEESPNADHRGDTASLTGSISGNHVSITGVFSDNYSFQMEGTAAADQMGGTGGSVEGSGTWSAVRL